MLSECLSTERQNSFFSKNQNQNSLLVKRQNYNTSPRVYLEMSRVVRKPAFCICENKDADQPRGNREADQRLCFRYTDRTIPLLSKSKFQASSDLLWLYSPVCVGPGRKPRRPVFSQRGSNKMSQCKHLTINSLRGL